MNKTSSRLIFPLLVIAFAAMAAPQWTPQEFVGLAHGNTVIVDQQVAGTSTIVILDNALKYGSTGETVPFDKISLVITRGTSSLNFMNLYLYPLEGLTGVGLEGGVLDVNNDSDNPFTFEAGDQIRFAVNNWNNGTHMDALTPTLATPKQNPNVPDFNPDYGIDNYFQHYEKQGKNYDGFLAWTFGASMGLPGPGTKPEANVSGQPLPGVLATMIIGLAAVTVTQKKKHKKA